MGHARLLRVAAIVVAALPAAASAATADPQVGSALFTGARPFQNGGAPCGACHATGGMGAGSAASLGPDLSRSFEGMAPDAIDGLLQDLPFPTMTPIYTGHALTPAERADLAAFLAAATGAPPARAGRIAVHALAIAAVALGILGVLRRRRTTARAQLTARPARVYASAPPRQPREQRESVEPRPDAARASGGAR